MQERVAWHAPLPPWILSVQAFCKGRDRRQRIKGPPENTKEKDLPVLRPGQRSSSRRASSDPSDLGWIPT